MDWRLRAALGAVAALPLAVLIWMVRRYAVDVPVWDQWELVPLLEKQAAGTIGWQDLWAQHNEHRLVFPRLVMLVLARISGWSILWELAVILLLAVLLLLVLGIQLRQAAQAAGQPHAWWWWLPVLSIQVFSLQQAENWLLGYEINVFLNVLMVALGCGLLARGPFRWRTLAAAAACGIVALYSFASGAVYWLVGGVLVAVFGPPGHSRWLAVGLWAGIAAIAIGTYLVDFHTNPNHPSLLFLLEQPLAYARYLATWLGAPVASFSQPVALWAGLLNLGLFPVLAVRAWRQDAALRRALAPFVALAVYALGTAAIIGLSRAGFGIEQAMSSRYITLANFLSLSNLALLAVLGLPGQGGWRWRAWALPLAGVLVLGIAFSSRQARLDFYHRQAYLLPARAALLTLTDDAMLNRLYPSLDILKDRARVLQALELSVYRDDER